MQLCLSGDFQSLIVTQHQNWRLKSSPHWRRSKSKST